MKEKIVNSITVIAIFSFVNGIFLMISNIQALRKPDGYPLDPLWLIYGLAFLIPMASLLLIGLIETVCPEKEKEEEKEEEDLRLIFPLYRGKSKDSLKKD